MIADSRRRFWGSMVFEHHEIGVILNMTTKSVTNFIFRFPASDCSQNHASDQLYFPSLHN